jgi:hypothetical protein
MAQTSFALMTNVGRAKEAAALANATTIEITHIAIGDGVTVPSGGETQLYHELARKTISGHGTVSGAANVAYFDCYLTAGEGPYTIREAGLYDVEGDLIAIAHYDPPINKPVPESGQTVEGTVRLEVAFSNVANITIVVDPTMQVALQRLTRLPWIPIMSMSMATPPASPAIGDTYLIAPSPTGAWAGNAGKIAEYTVAGWAMMTPPEGHGVSLPDGRVFERVGGDYVEKIAIDVQAGKWVYGEDTGSTNAIVVSLTPALTEYAAGFRILVKAAATNTGASTIKINALGIKAIKTVDGADLAAGAFKAGQMICLACDGTNFQFISVLGAAAFSLPKAKITLAAIASLAHATYTPHGMSVATSNDMGAGPSISGGNGVILPAGTYAFQIYTVVTITNTNNNTQVAWGCRITKNGTLHQAGMEGSYLTAGQNATLYPGFSGTIQVTDTDVIQIQSYIACTLSGDYGGGNAGVGFVTFQRIGA